MGSYVNNVGYGVPVPTPERHYADLSLNVYFRNKDGGLGQARADKCYDHKEAILDVQDAFRGDMKGPALAVIEGGKK